MAYQAERSGGDEVFRAYGGRSLHQRWHGESFLALFQNPLNPSRPALYLFDEPESALSTIAQFAFLRLLKRWETSSHVQVIVATHCPILLAYPAADIWDFDGRPMTPTTYEASPPYQLTRAFLLNHERFLRQIFSDTD